MVPNWKIKYKDLRIEETSQGYRVTKKGSTRCYMLEHADTEFMHNGKKVMTNTDLFRLAMLQYLMANYERLCHELAEEYLKVER